MSALKKIIICITLTSFFAAAVPQSAQAQFLAFAPPEIATAIKRFMGDIQNSQQVVSATKSVSKIKGAIGQFKAAMSSFLNNHLLERLQDVKRAKCKFDQKKKKLKCSGAFQTYKKVKSKVGEGKELINRGNKLLNDAKAIKAEADQLVKDAQQAAETLKDNLEIINEAKAAYSDVKRLIDEGKSLKQDYENMKNKVEDTVQRGEGLLKQAEDTLKEAKSLLERGNNLRKEGQNLISQAANNPKEAKSLKEQGEAKVAEAEQLVEDAKKMEDRYNSIKNEGEATIKQAKSLKDDAQAMNDKVGRIEKEACEVYTKYFSTEETRAKAAESEKCDFANADIGGAIEEKVQKAAEQEKVIVEYKNRATNLYKQAEAKVKEGEQLLADAKKFAKSLRDCKPGEDPKKDNCYQSEDAEYCKPDPEKDASDYCDKKYPKKNKTDTAAAASI